MNEHLNKAQQALDKLHFLGREDSGALVDAPEPPREPTCTCAGKPWNPLQPFAHREDCPITGADCRGCKMPLLKTNRTMADGCPCNSARGVNHGLVPQQTCTCPTCDPSECGGSRYRVPALPRQSRPHIIDGEFQSDKYPTTPRGKVPLSIQDWAAQDLLWQYAQRRRSADAEFAEDLETALRTAGYEPPREAIYEDDESAAAEEQAEIERLRSELSVAQARVNEVCAAWQENIANSNSFFTHASPRLIVAMGALTAASDAKGDG